MLGEGKREERWGQARSAEEEDPDRRYVEEGEDRRRRMTDDGEQWR
jgi:hypothetical protein